MDLAELLALLNRWNDLDAEERTSVTEALADLSVFTDEDLATLTAEISTISGAITEGDLDDTALEALEYLAVQAEAIRDTLAARADEDAERAQRAADLADRIRGDAGDEGEPEGSDDTTDSDDEADADVDADGEPEADADEAVDEPEQTREPVAASGGPRVSRVNARRPRSAAPAAPRSGGTAPLVAAAGVPNAQMGGVLDTPERLGRAFGDTIDAMASMALRPGMKVPVALARASFTDAGFLTRDARSNLSKIEAVTSPQAMAAAGGVCAPPVPRYDIPSFGVADRPVLGALTRFGAERGGVILPEIPRLTDLDGAVGFWTVDDDEDAVTDPNVRKPCLRVECGEDETHIPYAITKCLEIGNWNARTWPERITEFLRLLEVWTARQAETRLLQEMAAVSTNVSTNQEMGTTRDVLAALGLAVAAWRNRHRLSASTSFTWLAPAWLLEQMRSDLAREMPGSSDERLAAADVEIESFIRARNITPVWYLDGEAGQIFGSQADGPLNGWIPNAVTYLFQTGTWLALDGGELNLGVVRDSDLNSRNDYQIFSEFWEAPVFHGQETHRLNMQLCPTGAAAGVIDPTCSDVASS